MEKATWLLQGVYIGITPNFHIIASNANMLASDGKCKAFDQNADGFIPGEGVGAVILKSLEAAERDGDFIYGIVQGSGINQDGKTYGITAPSAYSQTKLEKSVYDKAKINPETISYVEAHGTGTKLGDPIEINALTDAFRKYTAKKQFCALGSVKTNIGHAAMAAGIASLVKVLLALRYKKIPPSLNFETQNEHINFQDSPFYVNTKAQDWLSDGDIPRRAAISSFGFSGTNCHVVIEEYKPFQKSAPSGNPLSLEIKQPYLIPLSAQNHECLKLVATGIYNCIKHLQKEPLFNLANISYTLQTARQGMEERLIIIANDYNDFTQKIERFLGDEKNRASVYKGNVLHPSEEVKLSKKDKTFQATIDRWIEENNWDALADFWVKGGKVNWQNLPQNKGGQKIPLPTYPFIGQRYWFADKEFPISSYNGTPPVSASSFEPFIEENSTLSPLQIINRFKKGTLSLDKADQLLEQFYE